MDELIPWLYLRGISTGDMQPALEALMGESAKGLSASVVTPLTAQWKDEYDAWRTASLSGKKHVYQWADGVYFNVRLKEETVIFDKRERKLEAARERRRKARAKHAESVVMAG